MTTGRPVSRPCSESRYNHLTVLANGEGHEADGTKEYAEFLREQERNCGPDGFLDSNKYTHTFRVRGKVLQHTGNQPRGHESTSSLRVPTPPRVKANSPKPNGSNKRPNTVVGLVSRVKEDEREFDKRMKLIEDNMWIHRQEERDLKRSEGDILKSQQILKRTMRDYETAINRKKISEEKKIFDNKQEEFFILNQFAHKKKEMTKEQMVKSLDRDQQEKDGSRRVFLSIGDLERKYQAKIAEIELRRSEVEKLSEEFVQRMKNKEDETSQLSRELAELALSISMEVKNKRERDQNVKRNQKADSDEKRVKEIEVEQTLGEKLKKNQTTANHFENKNRSMSAEADMSRMHRSEKLREEGRHLLDMRNRLSGNSVTQRRMQEQAMDAKQDWTNKQIEHKLQANDSRKQKQLRAISETKRTEHEESVAQWHQRFSQQQHEAQRKENEDSLKHASRAVTKLEEIEYNLSNQVRDAELDRKQREQLCKRMTKKLFDIRRKNAAKLKKDMVGMRQQEKLLEQGILREQSYLFKSHTNREEGYLSLQQHRMKMKEDRNILDEVSKEHQRLLRIGEKTDAMTSYP